VDRQLIVRAKDGDERAFADLTSAIGARLDRVAYGILRDRDLAEDAMQAALVQIWRKLPTLRDPDRFDAWSYKLLVHACYAEAKRSRRSFAALVDDIPGRDDLGAVLDRDQLERAFRRLSLEQRTVLVLRHYLDLAPETVADALGVPVGTVHSRVHRALDAMRASLEADARAVLAATTPDGGAR
jgi:RNA polymerase sigma-70 factor (ECF subfamily)